MGARHSLNYHTSPQAALRFRAYNEHSKRVPTASNKGETPFDCYALVGLVFPEKRLLKACTTETASILSRPGDMTDASAALLKGKEYVFSEAGIGLHCAFRLRAPFLGQQRVHTEGSHSLPVRVGESFIQREAVVENIRAVLFAMSRRRVVLLQLGGLLRRLLSLDEREEKESFVKGFS